MSSASLRIGLGCSMLAAVLTATPALADWPTPRHDPRRTGVSMVGSDIKKPAAYWRSRLGGAPVGAQVYDGDVNQDGSEDVLYVTGGELFLARPDGSVLWRTGSRGYNQIVSVVDLDLDGHLDVIVTSAQPSKVSIINGTTGAVEWEEPATELGSAGAFRVGDLDGDGRPDLWLDTCGCCALESGSPGIIYSFAKGFASPVKLGPPPARPHCNATSNTIGDFDGDGRLEMISMGETTATMFRADGTVVATSGPIPARAYNAYCEATNIDGQPGDELVCFANTVYAGAGQRGLYALAYRPAESPSLKLLWSMVASAADGGDAQAPASLTVDLDGDGRLEAVVSGATNGAYTAFVLDAATGVQLATAAGAAVGYIPGLSPGQRWLVVGANEVVTAYAFVPSPPGLNPVWQLSGQRVARQLDWARAVRSGLATSLVAPDLNHDGRPDLVLSSASEPTVLSGYDTGQAPPSALAHYALDPGVSLSALGTPSGFAGATSMFVARNDGFLALLDGGLAPENQAKEGAVTLPGMYVGGYYTGPGAVYAYGRAPIAGKLKPGDVADAVLVVDSRGDLIRIDPTGASNVAPAKPTWRLPDSFGAAMRPAGAGPAAIGVFRRRHPLAVPPVFVMASVSPDGQEIASLTLPRTPAWDVLPGAFAGSGSTGFVAVDADASLKTDITVMSASGQQLWQQTYASAGSQALSVADWDGDGTDDVVSVITAARVYSGATGVAIATGTDTLAYAVPILASLDGGPLDVVLEGSYFPSRALDHGLKSLWVSSGSETPFPLGSLARCGSIQVLVEGSFSSPSQLTFMQASGASAGAFTGVVLASGAAYPDAAAAMSAHATLGQLTDVAVSTDLDGAGSGPTALVGSSDGYLYAVDACKGTLRWALSFGVPVGSPILADTDGDGRDEILVSVADGYLYALKNEVLPAPSFVWDTDPPHDITDKDVDDIQTTNTLYATWAAVAGATSYEVAVVSAGGTYVTSPTWVDVGPVTSASIPNLQIVDGARYFVGVRAVSPQGKSPDTPSDGVVVHSPGMQDGGPGTGGSGTGGTGGGAGGAPPEILISGRSCTCSTPGGADERWLAPLGLLAAVAAACAGRRRAR
jgi:hypothetical protein